MIAVFVGLGLIATVIIAGLTGVSSSDTFGVALLIAGISLVVIGDSINSAKKEILDALAKGSAPQGTRQQGRDTTQAKVIQDQQKPYVLRGHWHKGRWNPAFGTGVNRRWQETRPVPDCDWTRYGYSRDCPDRNPFSTD